MIEINTIVCGDSEKVLQSIPINSVDLIVTDPPYGISFLNKDWDRAVPSVEVWKQCFHVLKPGAFMFVMSSPRFDVLVEMGKRLEQAGFEIDFTPIFWVYACLSEDSKILNEDGLVYIGDVKKGDVVYGFDIVKNELVKTKVLNKYIYDIHEDIEMFNLKNQDVDQLMTMNHKVLYKNNYHSGMKRWEDKVWKYEEAKNIKLHTGITLPLTAIYSGKESIGVEVAKLLGWVLSDGSIINGKKGKNVRISQSSVNMKYVNEIRDICQNLNINYKEYCYKGKYKERDYDLYTFYFSGRWFNIVNNLIPNKKPTKFLLELVYEERLALYNALISGDGTRRSTKKKDGSLYKESNVFYQKDEKFLDWFEMLVLGLGWHISRNRKKMCVGINKSSVTKFQFRNYAPKIVENYNGVVWCVETETNNFVAWRNGKYFITGNSGFNKGLNISKEVVDFFGEKRRIIEPTGNLHKGSGHNIQFSGTQKDDIPLTEQAKQLDGSYGGFSPKPACEVIIVCMKPLSENSYVEQALSNQKGITWLGSDGRIPFAKGEEIDAESCPALRISEAELRSSFGMNKKFVSENYEKGKLTFKSDGTGKNNFSQYIIDKRGRFPANLLVEDNVLDTGRITKTKPHGGDYQPLDTQKTGWGFKRLPFYGSDEGGFSRYFSLDNWWNEKIKNLPKSVQQTFPFLIVPKPSISEKDKGLGGFVKKTSNFAPGGELRGERANIHPTLKPLKLFSYLITIASRPNDVVLDPFVGSGTAVIAAKILDRNYIGIDISEEYCKIAEARLKAYKKQKRMGDDL